MKLIESETLLNLARAYAGECQAMVRYKFIEYGARMQEQKQLAQIIDQLVYNEFNHARMFYTKIQDASKDTIDNIEITAGFPFKEKWDLEDNLRLAAEDEKIEAEKIYPRFRDIAQKEGFKEIADLFDRVIQVEHKHHDILTKLYNQLHSNKLYTRQKNTIWKCYDCGYEDSIPQAWDNCPLCNAKQGSVVLHIENTI